MMWTPPNEDTDPDDGLRDFTVEVTLVVKMKITADKNADEDSLASLVIDTMDNVDEQIDTRVEELTIMDVEAR